MKVPGGEPGIGFDDLRYSPELDRVLAPAGRAGSVALVDPGSLDVTVIDGFSKLDGYAGGHDDGPTSVELAAGRLYVTDRTTKTLVVVDAASHDLIGSVPLASGPDYVRWVAATNELWVTEPSSDQLEIFSLVDPLKPAPVAVVPVTNGPESIVVDATRGRVYVHRWSKSSLAFDAMTHEQVAEWPNQCEASRGIALDEARGWLFAACNEGRVSVLDVANGALLDSMTTGDGFDVMGYDPARRRVHVAGGACGCLQFLSVDDAGKLGLFGEAPAPSSTHCVTVDRDGSSWVCDPDGGSLWQVREGDLSR